MATAYNNEEFFVWKKCLEGEIGKERAFELMNSYLDNKARSIIRTKIRTSLQQEEAIQKAIIRVWDAIKKERLPSESSKDFYRYLSAILSKEVLSYKPVCREEFPPDIMDGSMRRANPPVESRIDLEDFPSLLRKKVGYSILGRFPEVSVGAAKYVLDRFLNDEYISHWWLRKQYYIQDVDFFIESVMIATRISISDLSDDFYPISSFSSGSLYAKLAKEDS